MEESEVSVLRMREGGSFHMRDWRHSSNGQAEQTDRQTSRHDDTLSGTLPGRDRENGRLKHAERGRETHFPRLDEG